MLQSYFSSYWEPVGNRLKADDVNEILAWIDYCILNRLGQDVFEKSIVTHLSRSRQKDFTLKQISVKVEELWKGTNNTSRPNGELSSNYAVVYRIGTKVLRGANFTDERALVVNARVQQLMKQPVPEYAKASSRSKRKKRKIEHIGTCDRVVKRLFKNPERSRFESRGHSAPRKSPRDSISIQIPPSPSRTGKNVHTRQSHRDQSVVPKSEYAAVILSPTHPPISDIIEDSQSETASWYMADPELFLTPPREMAQQNNMRTATTLINRSFERYSSCSLTECQTVRQLLSDHERDLQRLRGKISEAERTIETLKIELESEEHRRAICENAAEAPTQETLRSYLASIDILRSQILNKEVLVPFTTRDIRKHMPFDREYFQNNMLDIKNEIDDFMCRCSEMTKSCNDIKLQNTPDDLRALVRRAIGDSRDTLHSISFHSLLRSILSAAVCEWVLERDVTEPVIAGCPLRDTMLLHLTTMDGEDVAGNLDFAAHHTLIKSDYFQNELIPRRAEALAMRLSDRMGPLFGMQNPLSLWEVDILEEWQQQRKTLKKMFVSALRVKTRALVSKDVFEVIFPLPGCEYDPAHVELERPERDKGDAELGQSPIVRLCLVPGLRKFPVHRKFVDYNSFRRPSTSSTEPGGEIASPLVIPE